MDPLREDIKQIIQLQREQNGRVARNETRLAVLEDRSPGRVASAVSAVVAGIISGLAVFFSGQK